MLTEQENEKVFQVNWSICGIIEIGAKSEEDAREIVANMSKKELQDRILEEADQSFEIGTVEEIKPQTINSIFSEMVDAVDKYGEDNVELLLSRDEGIFYINYHNRHNSHPIGNTYSIIVYSEQDLMALEKMCNEQGFDFQDM